MILFILAFEKKKLNCQRFVSLFNFGAASIRYAQSIFPMSMNIATTLFQVLLSSPTQINVPLFRKDFPIYLICRKSHKNYSALRFNVTVPSFPFASRRDLLAPHSQRRRRLLIFVEYFLDFGRTTLRAYCAVLSDEGRKI